MDASSKLVVVPTVLNGSGHAAGAHGLSWANPEGEAIIIESCVFDVTTPATGSATADIGVAANGTTSADTLMDGVNVGAAAIVANSQDNAGTNGGIDKMASGEYITVDFSADPTGLVGNLYIKYWIPSKAV